MSNNPTARIIAIGRCIGCNHRARLDAGVCRTCLEDPNRGRRWAEIAQRVRRDPALAATVYSHIKTDGGRRIFLGMFGAEVLLPKAHDRDEGREGSGT